MREYAKIRLKDLTKIIMKLYEITKEIQDLERLLQEDLTGSEQLEIIERAMQADTDFVDKVDNTLAFIKTLESYVTAYSSEIERLSKLKKSSANLRKTLRKYLLNQLEELEVSELRTKRFKVNIRKTPKKTIIDEEYDIDEIPDKYLMFELSLNKDLIKQDLESGEELDFAKLETSNSLSIR